MSNPYDIGVLILEQPVTGITPATLPHEGFLDDLREEGKLKHGSDKAKFAVVGYGGTLNFPPPTIEYNNYRQVAFSGMKALLPAWLFLSQNKAIDNGGSCYGDSGGPTFWINPDGTEIIAGITSRGDRRCVSTGFYYRIDTPEISSFISDIIDTLP